MPRGGLTGNSCHRGICCIPSRQNGQSRLTVPANRAQLAGTMPFPRAFKRFTRLVLSVVTRGIPRSVAHQVPIVISVAHSSKALGSIGFRDVQPLGNPISHSTQSGFKAALGWFCPSWMVLPSNPLVGMFLQASAVPSFPSLAVGVDHLFCRIPFRSFAILGRSGVPTMSGWFDNPTCP